MSGTKQFTKLPVKVLNLSPNLEIRAKTRDVAVTLEGSLPSLESFTPSENFVTAETLDKIIAALNTTPDELFSLNHLKDSEALLSEIQNDIKLVSQNPKKLEILYNLVKAIIKE